MSLRFYTMVIDSHDVKAQAYWWARALGWEVTYEADDEFVIESLEGFAGLAAATAAPRRAARLWGAADALRQEMGKARSIHLSIDYERQVKAVRAILTAEAFDQAWNEGRATSLDDAVRYALDEQAGRDY